MTYAGDLSPEQAWERLGSGAILVDVRTEAEWRIVGVPDTSQLESTPRFVQWNLSDGSGNQQFLEQLRGAVPDSAELIFLCRSGVRSRCAAQAATAVGYTSYNMVEGFEGMTDRFGNRTVNGWKNRGLPWSPAQE